MMSNGARIKLMKHFASSYSYIYNQALALHNKEYAEDSSTTFSWTKWCKQITQWKFDKDKQWLKIVPFNIIQQSIINLNCAFHKFFKKLTRYPRFKKKGHEGSFRMPNKFTVEQPIHPATNMAGLDMGIIRLATLSDGSIFEPVNSSRMNRIKLARYQRAMTRKVLRSNNWHKQRKKISRLMHRIANIIKDHLHKTTSSISKNHVIVVMEDLRVNKMRKSAKGIIENPGRNVKVKSGLNRSILDQAWYKFRRQLEYKLSWQRG